MRSVWKRLLQLIPVLFCITFFSFGLLRIAGSDAITQMYGEKGAVAQEIIDAKKAELGLDQPFLKQYFHWLGNFLKADMGISYVSGRDVFDTFVSKLPNTLLLAGLSVLLTLVISIPLGVLAAFYQNRWIDYLLRVLSFVGNSFPNFFMALIFMQIFSIKLHWLPVLSNDAGIRGVILPTLTLGIAMSGKYLRQVRAIVLEELHKDYVIGAKARGIKNSVILGKSVMKSAMLSLCTLLALSIGNLLGGTAIVETIFMWDGVGKLAVDAISLRDIPMIQAYVVWMAIIYVVIHLLTDLIYELLDPRIRLGVKK